MSLFKRHLHFLRVASVSPELRVGDIDFNLFHILEAVKKAESAGASIVVFPELSLTGSTCADLFTHSLFLEKVLEALRTLAAATEESQTYSVVGLPIFSRGRLYNVAALVGEGKILGVVPKTFLPSREEFYEGRWFTSGKTLSRTELMIGDQLVPFGRDLLFQAKENPACLLGIEICEDLWTVEPPSGAMAIAGAVIILNPSASNEWLGKNIYRKDLVKSQSARCLAGYVYASSGPGESSTDVVFSGHCLVAENGTLLAESSRFHFESQMILADIDISRLNHYRLRGSSFSDSTTSRDFYPVICSNLGRERVNDSPSLLRPNSPTPFVPLDLEERASTCREIFAIQSMGLAKRLKHLGLKRVVLGLSGGLDSTLALLATVHAFDVLKLPHQGILAVSMPGFGTSSETKGNAENLARLLKVEMQVISIMPAVTQHFKDIGHDANTCDATYENAQARERTQILMDLANKTGGLVVGTGDLSESALGWCTFNGDHMSMYHVNAGVPKTLVRFLIEWCADEEFVDGISTVLKKICATPISPELLPLGEDGKLEHHTEEILGPYELHDYFLYQMVRHGEGPAKILFLATKAFEGQYGPHEILRWLKVFFARFFGQQFKRSAMPDGPKVGSVALSPRGDWRMPSDASAELWLAEIHALEKELA